MDVFAWLDPVYETLEEQGEHRFLHRLQSLTHHVCDDDHDIVDAMIPELLADAKRIGHPWLEVFIRHWDLQSRILRRNIVEGALDDAVALLEIASREENRECPQSICAVQDLASGYGFADGPGFAPERLAVTEETLGRIDPSWPCFECISAERCGALRDAGRADEALSFLDAQEKAAAAVGALEHDFDEERGVTLLALGRPAEAEKLFAGASAPQTGEHGRIERRLLRARALGHLGRAKDALDSLPDFDTEIAPTPAFYLDWIDTVERLLEQNAETPNLRNDGFLDQKLAGMASRLEAQGALRLAFRAAEARARLALGRGQRPTAAFALESLERLAGRLKRPLDAPERLAACAQAIASAAPPATPELPETPEATLEALPDDPERAWQTLVAATERWPTSVDLLSGLAGTARNRHQGTLAIERLAAAARGGLGHDKVVLSIWGHLVWSFAPDELEAWAEARQADGPEAGSSARFVLGRRAEAEDHLDEARAHYEAVLAHDPDAKNTRRLLAGIFEREGELVAALDHLEALEVRLEDPDDQRSNDWRRVLIATRLQRWAEVRRLSERLGLDVDPGEGPIREQWHMLRLEYRPPLGDELQVVTGLRTGPVTAVVLTIADPGDTMRFREEVVFDPRPVATEEDEDGDEISTFPVVEVTAPSTYFSFFVEGARPPEASLEALEASLRDLGAGLARISDDDWQIHNEDEDKSLPGFYWLVALPEEADLGAADAHLRTTASQIDGLLVWRDLAVRRGDSATVAAQKPLIEAWGLL